MAGTSEQPTNFTASVLRAEDLLYLSFEGVNLTLQSAHEQNGQQPHLVRIDPSAKTYLIVSFAPQHIQEQAFFEATDIAVQQPSRVPSGESDPDLGQSASQDTPQGLLPPGQVEAILSGASQLVFEIPETVTSVPYTLDALLDWTPFTLHVAPNALPPITGNTPFPNPAPAPVDPRDASIAPVTAIEAPYRLTISPNALATWLNKTQPVTHDGRTELWHTRLAIQNAATKQYNEHYDAVNNSNLTIRAIWSPDWSATNPPHGHAVPSGAARFSLDARDRYELVQLSGNFTMRVPIIFHPLTTEAQAVARNIHEVATTSSAASTTAEDPTPAIPPSIATQPAASAGLHDAGILPSTTPLTTDGTIEGVHTPVLHPVPPIHLPEPSAPVPIPIPIPPLTRPFNPTPVEVNRLMLSSLGAWLDVRGAWTPPPVDDLSVEEWIHQAEMGRDQYVRVVYQGYLFPFGHRASLVKVTERKFYQDPNNASGPIVADLFQRMYIIVREPLKTYDASLYTQAFTAVSPANNVAGAGREMPFTTVRITTKVTPDLYDPTKSPSTVSGTNSSFWPMVLLNGNPVDFKFHLIGEDNEGQQCEFTASLIFLSDEDRHPDDATKSQAAIQALQNAYTQNTDSTGTARRICNVPGQQVAFARSTLAKSGATSLKTQNLYFAAKMPTANDVSVPRFLPMLQQADVSVPAIESLLGTHNPVSIGLYDSFVQNDIDPHAGVFAGLIGNLPLPFPGDKSGALVTPNITITGLSQTLGPVAGDIGQMAAGNFDPSTFFDDSAKILGGIPLKSIIQQILGGAPDFTGGGVPQLTTTRSAQAVTTTLTWTPNVVSTDVFLANSAKPLTIHATIVTNLTQPSTVTATVSGTLTNFAINFLGMIRVDFDQLTFLSQTGQKTQTLARTKPQDGVTFDGSLAFVGTLAKNIPAKGFENKLKIEVTTQQVDASYTLGLPKLAVGMFTLENISFSSKLTIPFNGDPVSLGFAFASRQKPFHIIVSLLGGGGFFGIAVGLDGLHSLEAALEFGAELAINLAVASGKASIMAGIYFKLSRKNGKDDVQLTGYVRIDGSLKFLDIITLSVSVYIGLTYDFTTHVVTGQAQLTVEIDIAFFSVSVSVTIQKTFGGSGSSGSAMQPMMMMERFALSASNGPAQPVPPIQPAQPALPVSSAPLPTFGDLETATDWADYCAAFA